MTVRPGSYLFFTQTDNYICSNEDEFNYHVLRLGDQKQCTEYIDHSGTLLLIVIPAIHDCRVFYPTSGKSAEKSIFELISDPDIVLSLIYSKVGELQNVDGSLFMTRSRDGIALL